MPYEPVRRNEVSEPAVAFLHDCVERSYGRPPAGLLRPALEVAYTRVAFAAPGRNERLTCDFDVTFSAPDGTRGRLARDMVIVESKSLGGRAIAEHELRALGARPEPGCHRMLPLLRRHFRPAQPNSRIVLQSALADPRGRSLPRSSARRASARPANTSTKSS